MNLDDKEIDMDLNVLVTGGRLEDRNILTVLIADTLHQQGFGAVVRETVGEAPSSLSLLDVIQDTRPHLFSENIHVIAVPDNHGMIIEDTDGTDNWNSLFVMTPTTQNVSFDREPPSPEQVEAMKAYVAAGMPDLSTDSFDHNARMAVILDSDDNDQAPLLLQEELEEVED